MAMLDSVKLYRDKGKEAWGKLTSKQKLVFSLLGVGVVALFVAIIVMVGSGTGGMVELKVPVKNNPSTAVRKLAVYGIQAEHDLNKAAVLVPKEKERQAAMILSFTDLLPAAGREAYGFLNESSLARTDETTRMMYLISLQNLLGETIAALPYVSQATVTLTPAAKPWEFRLPDSDLLAKASVVVELEGIDQLNEEQYVSIATLVAGALPSLHAANVNLSDTSGHIYIVDERWQASLSASRMKITEESSAARKVEMLLSDMKARVAATFRVENPKEKTTRSADRSSEKFVRDETNESTTKDSNTKVGSAGADGGEIGRDRRDDPGRAITNEKSSMDRSTAHNEPIKENFSETVYDKPMIMYNDSSLSITVITEETLSKEKEMEIRQTASKATTVPLENVAVRAVPPPKPVATGSTGVGEGLVAFLKSDNAMKLVLLVIALGSVVALMIMLKKSAPKPLTLVDEGMEEAEEPMVEVPGLPPVDQLHGNLVREKVVELVRKNPKAAANLVKRWMIFGK